MPYVALQLVGIQAVPRRSIGLGGTSATAFVRDLPLLIAFAILAAYTYIVRAPRSGADRVHQGHADLRHGDRRDPLHPRPARRLASTSSSASAQTQWPRRIRQPASRSARADHGACGLLGLRHPGARLGAGAVHVPARDDRRAAAKRRDVIRRNMAVLPAYSLISAWLRCSVTWPWRRRQSAPGSHRGEERAVVGARCCSRISSRAGSPGVGFAAIVIGALVPAAIMSIAAANLFTRNIYMEFLRPDATPQAHQTRLPSSFRWW